MSWGGVSVEVRGKLSEVGPFLPLFCVSEDRSPVVRLAQQAASPREPSRQNLYSGISALKWVFL